MICETKRFCRIIVSFCRNIILFRIRVGFYLYQNSKKEIRTNSSSQSETSESYSESVSETTNPTISASKLDIYGLVTPSIMSLANWEKVGKDNWMLNILTWENLTNSDKREIKIEGEEWIATKTLNKEDELNNYFNSQQTISDKVNNELAKQNWTGSDFN
jgi:hypothetical protein